MRALGKRRLAAIAIATLVGLAIVGWAGARQIRSPAQIAADTAAPKPSPITVPVARRTLSTIVIVRGTVRYGAAQPAVLGTSRVKQGSDIVTRAPRRRAELRAGDLALAVDGRPVFVLPGAIPMSRDLHRGLQGPDVRQLEQALSGVGLSPGALDGRYDAATEAAVSTFYLRQGVGPVRADRPSARAAAHRSDGRGAGPRRAPAGPEHHRPGPYGDPAEVQQARVDAVAARDALDTAVLGVATAKAKLASAQTLATTAKAGEGVPVANGQRDQATADADVAVKRAALNTALDDERIAQAKVVEVAPDAPPSDHEAAEAAVRAAVEAIPRAQAELDAAVAAANAARIALPDAQQRARADTAQAARDARVAADELRRARQAVRTARSAERISAQRARILSHPADTEAMRAIATAAADEERRTRAEVSRLSSESTVQVPANEILFFPTLPLRVDTVKAKRGSAVSGSVMNVTSSRLVVDSSLSVSDARLVRSGDLVTVEDQDLGNGARRSDCRRSS